MKFSWLPSYRNFKTFKVFSILFLTNVDIIGFLIFYKYFYTFFIKYGNSVTFIKIVVIKSVISRVFAVTVRLPISQKVTDLHLKGYRRLPISYRIFSSQSHKILLNFNKAFYSFSVCFIGFFLPIRKVIYNQIDLSGKLPII